MITLYDIATKTNQTWSVNVWKARYTLNIKNLPYTTEWIELPQIKEVYLKNNISPTSTNPDGSPFYTVPLIHDSSTSKWISDSWEIAKYLDAQYPETPRVIPEGEDDVKEVQEFMQKEFGMMMFPGMALACVQGMDTLNPPSREYYNVERAKLLSAFTQYKVATLDEVRIPEEDKKKVWDGLEAAFGKLAERFGVDEDVGRVKWFLGDKPSMADFVVGGALVGIRVMWGEESDEWKNIKKWNDGKWAKYLEALPTYQNS